MAGIAGARGLPRDEEDAKEDGDVKYDEFDGGG